MWVKGSKGKSQANPKGKGERQFSNGTGGWAEMGDLMLFPSFHYRRAGILAILCTGRSQATQCIQMLAVSVLGSNAQAVGALPCAAL